MMNYSRIPRIHKEFVDSKSIYEEEDGIKYYYTLLVDFTENRLDDNYAVAQFLNLEDIFRYINRERDFLSDLDAVLEHEGIDNDQRDAYLDDIYGIFNVSKGINGRKGITGIRNAFQYFHEIGEKLTLNTYMAGLPSLVIAFTPINPTIKIYPKYDLMWNNSTRKHAIYAMNLITQGKWPKIENNASAGAGASGTTGGRRRRKTQRRRSKK